MDRKKMLIGGVVAVVVLVVIVFFAWPSKHAHQCIPSKEKPVDATATIVSSAADKVIASLAGYVEFVDDEKEKTYLPVDIVSVSIDKSDANANVAVLEGKCQTLVIKYKLEKGATDKDPSKYTYNSIELKVNRNEAEAKNICSFNNPFTFSQPASTHYACDEEKSHKCSEEDAKTKTQKPIANLVLTSFGLELDADEAHVKENKFGKDAWADSCKSWSK